MAPRGRPPTPTPLRKLDGNPGKRPMNEDEPEFEVADASLAPPFELDQYGMELWTELYPKLIGARVMTVADRMMFAAACEQWSIYRRATRAVRRGLVQRTASNGRTIKPEVSAAKGALRDVFDLLREWGVGASSRSRIKVPLQGEEADPFEQMLTRKKA